jgi:hypothetical protein
MMHRALDHLGLAHARRPGLGFNREEESKQEEYSRRADQGKSYNYHPNLPGERAFDAISFGLQFDWITSALKHE